MNQTTAQAIVDMLNATNQFDLVVIASLISGYLLFFVLGFTAGTIIKLMKKA